MVKRKKLWEFFFLQLFRMACKLPVALNTDMRSVAFRLFKLHYFISHFLFHTHLFSYLYQNGKNLIFFARKFRQQLESKGEVVTFTS